MNLPKIEEDHRLEILLKLAFEEDLGTGDVTTDSLVDPGAMAEGRILSREDCRIAGVPVAMAVFKHICPEMEFEVVAADGEDVAAGGDVLRFKGPARAILIAERTALNFMQRMCGIATMTRSFTRVVEDLGTMILDTRKTTPALRFLEKYSVLCGGGTNHRMGLYDRVLMKDNHRKLWAGNNPGRLDLAVLQARKCFPNVAVEIEVESLEELRSALDGHPEWVMLDNMDCETMRQAVAIAKGKTLLEASGGITMKNLREVAETGVDAISFGCLTHSVKSIDLSLEWSAV